MIKKYIPNPLEAMHGALIDAYHELRGNQGGVMMTPTTFNDLLVRVKVKLLKKHPGKPTDFAEWLFDNNIKKASGPKAGKFYFPRESNFFDLETLHEMWANSLKK